MADLRHWNKDFISQLIEYYKSFPCLWKVKSEDYKNKALKDEAYESIVEFCKENGILDANRDFVVKKLQSLRGSFRKECRKLEQGKNSGKRDHKPGLWYYDMLLFTKDQETESGVVTHNLKNNETLLSTRNGANDSLTSRKRKIFSKAPVMPPPKVRTEVINAAKDLSEFEAVGINMAKKMAKMDPVQAIYAEALINNVLKRGLLRKLTEDTEICDNCNNMTRQELSNSVNLGDRTVAVQNDYSEMSYFDVQEKVSTITLAPAQTQVYQVECPKNELNT